MGLNEVFKKVADIESKATELANHKIDLGLIQELESVSKRNNDLANQLDADFTKYASIKNTITSNVSKLTALNNEVSTKINVAIKQARDLGVESPDLFKYAKYSSDITMLIKDISNKLK